MVRRTIWLDEFNRYYALVCENDELICYVDKDERRQGNVVINNPTRYIGGSVIDLLAEYEDTGLSPEEIKKLKYTDFKKLQESNAILRKNNDEYVKAYQKLLDENNLLKKLLKDLLEKEIEE